MSRQTVRTQRKYALSLSAASSISHFPLTAEIEARIEKEIEKKRNALIGSIVRGDKPGKLFRRGSPTLSSGISIPRPELSLPVSFWLKRLVRRC